MINPPRAGTFSTPQNSICQKKRLKNPTMGLITSSAHCGNIGLTVDARELCFLTGYVPFVLNALPGIVMSDE
jgi:hypothetical protein